MNVTIWNSQSKVEKLYVNPTIEFEFLSRHQILSLKLNNDRYPIAHYKETFFDCSYPIFKDSFNLLSVPDSCEYVIDVPYRDDPDEDRSKDKVRVKDFQGFNEKEWDKEHAK